MKGGLVSAGGARLPAWPWPERIGSAAQIFEIKPLEVDLIAQRDQFVGV
jgi:hypothetical protein